MNRISSFAMKYDNVIWKKLLGFKQIFAIYKLTKQLTCQLVFSGYL